MARKEIAEEVVETKATEWSNCDYPGLGDDYRDDRRRYTTGGKDDGVDARGGDVLL